MLVLITYDINTQTDKGRRRLQRIAKHCLNYGQRVQNSVYECDLDHAQFIAFRDKLLSLAELDEDSIRFYNLGNHYVSRIEHYGTKECYDPEEELIL